MEGLPELKDEEVNFMPRFAVIISFSTIIELKFYRCCLDFVNFHNYKRDKSQAYLGKPTIWYRSVLERSYDYATMRDIPEQFVICNRTGSPLYLKYLYTGQFIKIWARYSHWGAWLSTSKRSTGKWGKYFAILNRNNSQ